MTDTATNPHLSADDIRTAPPPRPYRGPVFIGDALTPLGGTTLLHLLWTPSDR